MGQNGGQQGQQGQQGGQQAGQQGQPQAGNRVRWPVFGAADAASGVNRDSSSSNQNTRVAGAGIPRQLAGDPGQIEAGARHKRSPGYAAGGFFSAGRRRSQDEAEARRAADLLKEAEQNLQAMRGNQSSNQVDEIARQADDLARHQQAFEGQMRRAVGGDKGLSREEAGKLANEKDGEIADLKKLEQEMQSAVRDLMSTQRQASSKMREALGQMQQQEIARDMQKNADWIRRGMGDYTVMSEAQITAGLNDLRDNIKKAQQAMGPVKGAERRNKSVGGGAS